jgi:hypothetical protein
LEKANGIDNNPVEPYTNANRLLLNILVQDTIDMAHLKAILWYGRKIGFSIAV